MQNIEICKEGMKRIVGVDASKCLDHKGFSLQSLAELKTDIVFLNMLKLEEDIERLFIKEITKSIEFVLKLPKETINRQAVLDVLYKSHYINHGFTKVGTSLINESVLKKDWHNFKYLLKFNQDLGKSAMIVFFAKGDEYKFEKISLWNMVHQYNWCATELKQSIIEVLEKPVMICNKFKINFNISTECKQNFFTITEQNDNKLFELKHAIQAKNYIPYLFSQHKTEVINFFTALNIWERVNKIKVPKPIKFSIMYQICGFDEVKAQVENCLNY